MNITLAFTDTGGTEFPEGASVTFEDVDACEVGTPIGIEEIDCQADGCPGCSSVHRRLTGKARLTLEASGPRTGGPFWKIPKAAA
jgi:hypothetical protein